MNANGRAWARFWLIVALVVSVVANVTHTVLAESIISLWLRVPGAFIWPVFTFAGIEILVRIVWERRASHIFARLILLAAAVPAAITSYQHQFSLLGMMGEIQLIQLIGPLAIDGLMIGCTMTLLFTRELAPPVAVPSVLEVPAAREITPAEADVILMRYEQEMIDSLEDIPDEAIVMNFRRELEKDVPPPPSDRKPSPVRTRVTSEVQEKAVLLLLEGQKIEDVATAVGAGKSTVGRWAKVVRMVRDEPACIIDYTKERVSHDFVEYVRKEVNSR